MYRSPFAATATDCGRYRFTLVPVLVAVIAAPAPPVLPVPNADGTPRSIPLETFHWGARDDDFSTAPRPLLRGDHVLILVHSGCIRIEFPRRKVQIGGKALAVDGFQLGLGGAHRSVQIEAEAFIERIEEMRKPGPQGGDRRRPGCDPVDSGYLQRDH